jgi:hypothetical protein
LFDERGERLTPRHAVKGERRYRYYVSRQLLDFGELQSYYPFADRFGRPVLPGDPRHTVGTL